jgi:sigma-B regulation protein RsbU (phosphoserine phosphatase)
MAVHRSQQPEETGFWKTIRNDLNSGNFIETFRRDLKELKEYYLDEARRDQLQKMGKVKRWFLTGWWILKIFFLRLTSLRRILLLVGLILLLQDRGNANNNPLLGGLIILFILMLELKDKLLAHHELAEGHAVQEALMPDRSPAVPGWQLWLFTRPANEVGGDLVDFLKINEQRFGLALGDVVGKGLGAALFMAKLQATLRAIFPDDTSLGDLGEKINRIFHRDTLPNSFASLIYLEIQANSGAVRFVNAGHMPPVILRPGQVEEMPAGGPALGLMPKANYSEQTVELSKGEVLVIYSDGVTEARNEAGDFFGEERLFEIFSRSAPLSATAIGERLLAEVTRFIGKAKPHDDLSLVVLKQVI